MRDESWDGEAVMVASFPSKGSEDVATLSDGGLSGDRSGCAVNSSCEGVCLRRPLPCEGDAERRLEEGLPLDADIIEGYVRREITTFGTEGYAPCRRRQYC